MAMRAVRKMTKLRQKWQINHFQFNVIWALRCYTKNYASTTIFFRLIFLSSHTLPCHTMLASRNIVYLSLFYVV